jgi:hypothetical protein
MMYYCDEGGAVRVLNGWDLATVIPSSGTPNMDRTKTIPFMALQLLSVKGIAHMFRHDVESFIWAFLWVCGCSDGSKREVLVAPYKAWRELDILDCKNKRRSDLESIKVSAHHAPNNLLCLYLADLLRQLCTRLWIDIPTNADQNFGEQKDMAIMKAYIPKFLEVRADLNRRFPPGGMRRWSDGELIRVHITTDARHSLEILQLRLSILSMTPELITRFVLGQIAMKSPFSPYFRAVRTTPGTAEPAP